MISKRSMTKRNILFFAFLVILLPYCSAKAVKGQENQSSKSSISTDLTVTELDPEDIKAFIREIEATDMDGKVKTILLNQYKETLEQIQLAETWIAKIAQYQQTRRQVPIELVRIKNKLQEKTTLPPSQTLFKINENGTLEQLTQQLNKANTELITKRQAAEKVDDEMKRLSDRRAMIPQSLVEANARLEQVVQQLNKSKLTDMTPEIASATKTALSAKQRAIKKEIRAYKEELRLYDVLSDLLVVQRKEAEFHVAKMKEKVKVLEKAVSERRQAESEQLESDAEKQLIHAPEPVLALVQENKKLAQERTLLAPKIDEVSRKTKKTGNKFEALDNHLDTLRKKVNAADMGAYIGSLLIRQRKQLPEIAIYKRDIRKLNNDISSVQVRLLELEEQQSIFTDIDALAFQLTYDVKKSQPHIHETTVMPVIKQILQERIDTIESLRQDYEDYWHGLVALNILENRIMNKIKTFHQFIGEHVLWIPSAKPMYQVEFPKKLTPSSNTWGILRDSLFRDVAEHPILYLVIALLPFLSILSYQQIQNLRRKIDDQIFHAHTDSFSLTLEALGSDLLLSIPAPLMLWFIGFRLSWNVPTSNAEVYDFAQALSQGLYYAALSLFTLTLLKHLCRQQGIAEAHFQWNNRVVQIIRRNVPWLIFIAIPIVFLVNFARNHPDDLWRGSVSRIAFIIGMSVLLLFIHLLLNPKRGVFSKNAEETATTRLRRLFWYFLAMAAPTALILTSILGYHYTAMALTRRIIRTMWIIIGLIILRSTIIRAVFIFQQKLNIKKTIQEPPPTAEIIRGTPSIDEKTQVCAEKNVSEQKVGEQSKTLLRWLMAFGVIMGIWGIWQDIIPAFDFMNRIEIWSYTVDVPAGSESVSDENSFTQTTTKVEHIFLTNLLFAIILAMVTIVLATNGPNVLETIFLARIPIDAGARFAIAAILRYMIIVVGLILAFNAIGIGWSKVQWLAAAITVGLGFGLQEIFANFVSGLIILLERPVRVGDFVTVGDIYGKVTNIKMRATTVTDRDRRDLIVPNKEFITSQIINWTLSLPYTRIIVPVGIAYGSDTTSARQLLLKAAKECEYVLDEPAPSVVFRSFGDSALDFQLRVYISNLESRAKMFNDLHTRIDNAFRQSGIELAFPQRDIHVRTIQESLPIIKKRHKDQPSLHKPNVDRQQTP